MKHHVYEFDGKMMKQSKGGPIGLNLTGDLAAIYMAWWDKEFQTKIKEHGIETMIYKRYVDDIDLAVQNCKKNGNEDNHTQRKTNETPEGKREKEAKYNIKNKNNNICYNNDNNQKRESPTRE